MGKFSLDETGMKGTINRTTQKKGSVLSVNYQLNSEIAEVQIELDSDPSDPSRVASENLVLSAQNKDRA